MGNFRHQSIRNTDRDKDKDGDRERERDIRDKEGQERLRSVRIHSSPASLQHIDTPKGQLSDKYDRDRLAMTSGTTIRNKDRDAAPHLNSGKSVLFCIQRVSYMTDLKVEMPLNERLGIIVMTGEEVCLML